nr:uncharacterized protein LOC103247544 [Chlorocebus sabaeus]
MSHQGGQGRWTERAQCPHWQGHPPLEELWGPDHPEHPPLAFHCWEGPVQASALLLSELSGVLLKNVLTAYSFTFSFWLPNYVHREYPTGFSDMYTNLHSYQLWMKLPHSGNPHQCLSFRTLRGVRGLASILSRRGERLWLLQVPLEKAPLRFGNDLETRPGEQAAPVYGPDCLGGGYVQFSFSRAFFSTRFLQVVADDMIS